MKNKKNLIIVFVVVVVLLFTGFFLKNKPESYIEIAGRTLKVDLAVSAAEKERGLSGREALPEDSGMLFVFEDPGRHSFWMKDMNFPIDMIWLNPVADDGEGILEVVYIKKNARPESYPEVFDPGIDSKYVLEVVSGFSDENSLKVGDKAVFTR